HSLDIEQVDRGGDARAERPDRALDHLRCELVAFVERPRPDTAREAVAFLVLHELEEVGLLALHDELAHVDFHRAAPRVGLHAADFPAGAPGTVLLDDHVTDLPRPPAPAPRAAFEDRA